MKTLFIIIISFLVLTLECKAQYILNQSTAPQTASFDISGSGIFDGGTGTTITINSNQLKFNRASSNSFIDQTGIGGAIQFRTSIAAPQDKIAMTILSSGNVGAGATLPTQKFEINGGSLSGLPATSGTTQTNGLFRMGNYSNSNGVLDIGTSGITGAWLQATSKADLSSNLPLLLNPNGGNVGIGTTTPDAKLNIELATSTTPLSTADEGLRFSTSEVSTSNSTHVSSPFIKLFGGIWNGSANSSRGFTQQVTGISGDNYGYRLAIGSTDFANALSITGLTGNVGIGTTTPDQKLSVNGNIHGKSMIVDLAGLPDYVFHSNYYLPSLESVQAYIDKNHHLQDVPTATDIEKSGMDLGEMNKVLLKKVEELTLYVIDLNKQLKEEQKEIQHLKARK